MTTRIKVSLLIILFLALGLRVYKLDSAPPSISWDEAAVGYNAWTIANYGRDEYGKLLPLYFRSFGEGKNPVDIYITSIFVGLLDLNEVSVRLPSAVFGVLNVLLIFFLAKNLFPQERTSSFDNDQIALLSSLFLAISPYNIHFSRFNHEANFALFFLILGIILFYLYLKKSGNYLILSVIAFIVSFLSYNPPKLVVPIMVLLLMSLYWKTLMKNKSAFFTSFFLGTIFVLLIFFNPQILATERIRQTSLGKEAVEKTRLYRMTHNEILGRIDLTLTQYLGHFTTWYLFETGDDNPRLSSQGAGQFYKIDALFLIAGLIYLVQKRSKEGLLILTWAAFAPLPSALVAESPHAARSMFMMGSWHIISALGFYFLINIFKKQIVKWIIIAVVLLILTVSCVDYLRHYFGEYVKRYAIEWQYGMKQIVEYAKEHPEYNQVFMTDARAQPYIFFLFYLRPNLKEYLNSVIYNNNLENRSYNNVSNFERYYFGGWDPIESFPNTGVLYVVTPSQYDGLRHKSLFNVGKIVYYPNGLTAFYLVSVN